LGGLDGVAVLFNFADLAFIGASLPAIAIREAEVKPGRDQGACSMTRLGEFISQSNTTLQG
jgi:hypothetical protein